MSTPYLQQYAVFICAALSPKVEHVARELAWLPAPLDSLSSSEGLVKVAGYLAWTDDGVI